MVCLKVIRVTLKIGILFSIPEHVAYSQNFSFIFSLSHFLLVDPVLLQTTSQSQVKEIKKLYFLLKF